MMMRPAVVLALALFAAAAHPQTVADALRAGVKPIMAADLPDGYRAVSLVSGENSLSPLYLMGMGGGSESDPQTRLFFSLVSVTFVNPDEFAELLDGKRPRIRAYSLDVTSMFATAKSGSTKVPVPIFSESWIEAGRVTAWTPRPALTKEAILQTFATSAPGRASSADRTQTMSNAKQVAIGVLLYSGDFDDRFPAADSTEKAQTIVMPYIRNRDIWKTTNPAGGRLLYNVSLSGLASSALAAISEVPLLWDEKPWPDGGRVVAYADGHVKYATPEDRTLVWSRESMRRQKAKIDAAMPRPPNIRAKPVRP